MLRKKKRQRNSINGNKDIKTVPVKAGIPISKAPMIKPSAKLVPADAANVADMLGIARPTAQPVKAATAMPARIAPPPSLNQSPILLHQLCPVGSMYATS